MNYVKLTPLSALSYAELEEKRRGYLEVIASLDSLTLETDNYLQWRKDTTRYFRGLIDQCYRYQAQKAEQFCDLCFDDILWLAIRDPEILISVPDTY